jgi:protein-disulfide isomerase
MRHIWTLVIIAVVLLLAALVPGLYDTLGEWVGLGKRDASNLPSVAELSQPRPGDHMLGSPDAPRVIVEYGSLSCPHCAHFHQETLPILKAEWLESGKALYVFRHYPLDDAAFAAALIADCVPEERFFAMLDLFFGRQRDWVTAEDPEPVLTEIAAEAGLSEAEVEACKADEEARERILRGQVEALESVKLKAVPSFLVDGELMRGSKPYSDFLHALQD